MIYKRNRNIYYFIRFFINVMFIIPIWVSYYQGFLTGTQISLLVTTQYAIQTLFEIPSGAIADLLGRKNTISLGILIGAIGVSFIPFAREFWQFLILVSLTGMMDSFVSGSEEALLYDSLKQDGVEASFKQVFSKSYIILQIGLLTGSFLGGYLYSISKTLPYILDGSMLAMAFIASLFYIEPKIDSEKFSWENYKKQFKLGILESFKNPHVAKISTYFIAVGGITWASQVYFNTAFLTTIVESDSVRGWIQGAIRLINILLLQFFVSKHILSGFKQKIMFFPIVMLLAYLPGMFITGIAGVPLIYLATLASTLRWVYMAEIVNPLYESKYRATAISTMSMLVNVANISLYLLSGLLIPLGGIGLMYTVLGLLTLAFVVPTAVSAIRSENQKKEVWS